MNEDDVQSNRTSYLRNVGQYSYDHDRCYERDKKDKRGRRVHSKTKERKAEERQPDQINPKTRKNDNESLLGLVYSNLT